MRLKLIVSIKEIQYTKESVGRELDFTISIKEATLTFHQRIQLSKQGKTTVSTEKEVFAQSDVPPNTDIELPIKVTIAEQDKDALHHDVGTGEGVFSLHIEESNKQTYSLEVLVVALQGSDKGKEALFTLFFETDIIDEDIIECLNMIENTIGPHTEAELNDVVVTVFGELSPSLHQHLAEEAEAIVSTVFNRRVLVEASRLAYQLAREEEAKAQQVYNDATAAYNELVRHPSKYKRELGIEEYDQRVSTAKEYYKEAQKALASAQKARIDAISKRDEAKFFVSTRKQNQSITLTDIVALHSQYEGARTGKAYVKAYPTWSYVDQKRNCERWKAARAAVEKLAQHPEAMKDYIYFITNKQGGLSLKSGRIRIGGNDFWE